jgi:hypothetical protein
MSSLFEFIKAVLKHWGILVTSGVGIGALGIWQGTGRYIPHWVYWSVAAIGLVAAFYKTWNEERQQVVNLAKRLDGEIARQKRESEFENQRELIRVIAALHTMQGEVLRWRDIVKDKFGMAPDTVRLLPEEWPTIVFQAAKISANLRKQVDKVGKTVAEADSTIIEFLRVRTGFRDERLMPIAYRLLDEAAPQLSTVITEFEASEKSLG